ncbi:hypothetical protein TNCV_2650421 [Trichonephila clavipes]|nr:hypothetical protein TNCV_2650421 [Trichonephila clavipes]
MIFWECTSTGLVWLLTSPARSADMPEWMGTICFNALGSMNTRLSTSSVAPDESCVETSWKSAGGTGAGTAIGNTGAQMLVKLLELERLLEIDHAYALVSLFLASRDFRVSFFR